MFRKALRWLTALCYAWLSTAALAQNAIVPTRPAGDNSNAAASTAFVQQNGVGGTVSVVAPPFNADPTGVVSATTPIQNAINALPVTGGTVVFPCGTYKIDGAGLKIGNGSNGVVSTRQGVYLIGVGTSMLPNANSPTAPAPCVTLSWAGSAGGTMVEVDGVLQGWGIQNIAFQCGASNSAGYGIHNISGQFGYSLNLSFANCTTESLGTTTWTTVPGGYTSVNALHNYYSNVIITVPNVSNAIGLALRGDTSNPVKSDTAYDEYHNFTFFMPQTGALTTRGLYVGVSDSSYFHDFHFIGGVATTVEMTFDYSQVGAAAFPTGHVFVGLDPSGSLVPPIRYQAIGTQAGAFPNLILGLNQINGAGFPAISGLCAQSVVRIDLCGANSGFFTISASSTGTPQYGATATNDNAPAGNIGEYISSSITSGAPVSLSTGVSANITSISLTAGDWDVWVNAYYAITGSTLTNAMQASISTTSATLDTTNGRYGNITGFGTTGSTTPYSQVVGPTRIPLSSTTTVFFVENGVFSGSTMTGYGIIQARRAR